MKNRKRKKICSRSQICLKTNQKRCVRKRCKKGNAMSYTCTYIQVCALTCFIFLSRNIAIVSCSYFLLA